MTPDYYKLNLKITYKIKPMGGESTLSKKEFKKLTVEDNEDPM